MSEKKKNILSLGGIRSPGRAAPKERDAERLLGGVERLVVEVSEVVHVQVRARALAHKDLKTYLLWCIEARGPHIRKGEGAFPAVRGKKRFVADLSTEMMERIREQAKEVGTVREFVLRCLEADGVVVR